MAEFDTILIRYGELSTKGKNKKDFIARLDRNLRTALSDYPACTLERTYDRIYIRLHGSPVEEVEARVAKVFGISSFSLTRKVPSSIEAIVQEGLAMAKEEKTGTFKVVTRRHDKQFPLVSDQINREVASVILNQTDHRVDVHHPDFKIYIEVQNPNTYMTSAVLPGAQGYPVGVNGKALVLLSGGIDSPVAAWSMMKRGMMIEAIHFAAPPYTSTQARDKVMDLAHLLTPYQDKIVVHVIPFTDLQLAIYKACGESYAITIMRRMMMRIANKLAQKRKCLCLATGESLGQVASQTIESIGVINQVSALPIIRPLVCLDKLEIIQKAKEIGTYETSIQPYEDCCTIFDPKNPVTKPHEDKVVELEARFEWEPLVDACVRGCEDILVKRTVTKPDFL